jgi:Xaa-Pro aminopeptidase
MNLVYAERRARLMKEIGSGIVILATASEATRNADTHYPYRPDSNFWYLTGFTEPGAVLVLDASRGKSILFCREKNLEREIWDGFRHGPQGAIDTYGFDEAYTVEELDARMPDLLAEQPQVFWPVGRCSCFDKQVAGWLDGVRARFKLGIEVPACFGDVVALLNEMRVVKDDAEIAIMRRAGKISAEAHARAMKATRPGMMEYQIEAELLHTFVRHGARSPSFESIVAGGANATTLHYVGNQSRLNDGDLLLIDAGCELNGYAGDISRTFPINGKFSAAQRDVYEIVLAAQLAAIEVLKPGVHIMEPSDAALKVLAQGMIDLKLLTGTVDGVIESEAYRQFYMHGLGHMLGLDVHDVGKRKVDGQWRLFKPGMITTVEPGLYIRPAANVPEALQNIGIRIEDDVLITANGHEVYTSDVPKRIDEIEALMAGG